PKGGSLVALSKRAAMVIGLGLVLFTAGAASAQTVPSLPDVPQPPSQAQPAIGVVASAARPACGAFVTALVLAFLLGPTAGVPVGTLFPVLVPGLEACG